MTLNDAYNIYISLGLTPDKARLAAAQTAVETAYKDAKTGGYVPFTSPIFLRNNNVGGVMYINKPFQKDSVAGLPFPINESKTAKYAKFGSIESGFRDKLRIITPALNKSSNPVEYAHHLKIQGYYTGNESDYAKGLARFYNQLSGAKFIDVNEKAKDGKKVSEEKVKTDEKKNDSLKNDLYIYIIIAVVIAVIIYIATNNKK